MAIFAYMLLGIVVGVIVRLAMPASGPVGFWRHVLLGAVGGLFGGLIASTLSPRESLAGFSPVGFVLAALLAGGISVGMNVLSQRGGGHA